MAGVVQKGYRPRRSRLMRGSARPAMCWRASTAKRLIDEFWRCAVRAGDHDALLTGVTIDEIERRNVAKLSRRYPAGFGIRSDPRIGAKSFRCSRTVW